MLTATQKSDNAQVLAMSASKAQAPFMCPACEGDVVLRQGSLRMAHFAHKPPVTCQYGKGESELHRRCKMEIYQGLLNHPDVKDARLERYLQTVRPDVSAWIMGVPVAIEVQISSLPLEAVISRTEEYSRRGIHILWLSQWTPNLDEERYAARPWEKWVHAAYFGRIYYWQQGLSILPYHFAPVKLHVPTSEWYDEHGHQESAGGYTKKSKRYRNPVKGQVLNLLSQFSPTTRDAWECKSFKVPAAKLFMDQFRVFPAAAKVDQKTTSS